MTRTGGSQRRARAAAPWLIVLFLATAIDLAARFGTSFHMGWVLWVEAVLFPLSGLVLLVLFRRSPARSEFWRKVQIVLVAGFLLAGLRSALWAGGMPVGRANLVTLGVAVVAWAAYRFLRRGR